MKSINAAFIFLTFLVMPTLVLAEQESRAASESRDASLAFVGTNNFIVGRIGSECLATIGRSESPQQFVGAWQQRNMKYVKAADVYMQKRLEEAQASGGAEKRAAVFREVTAVVRSNSEATIRGWFEKDGKEAACKRIVGLIEAGAFDISPRMPMYVELESLTSWAMQQGLTSQ